MPEVCRLSTAARVASNTVGMFTTVRKSCLAQTLVVSVRWKVVVADSSSFLGAASSDNAPNVNKAALANDTAIVEEFDLNVKVGGTATRLPAVATPPRAIHHIFFRERSCPATRKTARFPLCFRNLVVDGCSFRDRAHFVTEPRSVSEIIRPRQIARCVSEYLVRG